MIFSNFPIWFPFSWSETMKQQYFSNLPISFPLSLGMELRAMRKGFLCEIHFKETHEPMIES